MLDFTSALYLGLRHPTGSLRPWSQFTTGVPAALAPPPGAEQVAQQLASLQGCEHGVLGASTFHLFWDLFGMLSRRSVVIFVDAGTYPIARWGIERAAARGLPVHEFGHHDPEALRRTLMKDGRGRPKPVLVTDGFCPACGQPAPLSAYLDSVRALGGWLIVDDTQALGIFGLSSGPDAPYGRGGGGMLPRIQVGGPDILVVSSLAKAFGAPVAVLSGSRSAVEDFEAKSETSMHCSPPSLAVIRTAEHALQVNRENGDRLRLRLARFVVRFRHRAAQVGFRFGGNLFPVQTIALGSDANTLKLHQQLSRRGVQTVLHRVPGSSTLRVSFLLSAQHTPEEIDRATAALAECGTAICGPRNRNQRGGEVR
jgi:8-amino-7-oxononanoate synthase